MARISVPSLLAGAALSLSLVAVPAYSMTPTGPSDPPDPTGKSDFDGSPPILDVEPLNFAVGQSIDNTDAGDGDCGGYYPTHSRIPLELTWSASDAGSGVASFDVILNGRFTGGPVNVASEIQETTWSIPEGTDYNGDCGGGAPTNSHYVLARDFNGNLAISRGSGTEYVSVWQEDGMSNPPTASRELTVTERGNWRQGQCQCFDAGNTLYSVTRGNQLVYDVPAGEGQTVAVVMEKNNRKGEVWIRLNDERATLVDTYSDDPQHRTIVWEGALREGSNTVKITNRGTDGRPRVDVDAVMRTSGNRSAGELYLDIPNG